MTLTYTDHHGQRRLKRRYSWALWGYAAGLLSGLMLAAML